MVRSLPKGSDVHFGLAEKFEGIAQRFGVDVNSVLDNLLIARAFNSDQQEDLIQQLGAAFLDGPFALLVIDSITSLLRVDFTGRGELAPRQQKLGKMLSMITKLANEFDIAVVITNQVD